MGEQVTDPALLAQLNAQPQASRQVTDPALLAQLNAPETQPQAEPSTSLADIGRNFLSAAMRPIIYAVGAIPEMAANAGVGFRNLSERGVNKFAPQFADAIYSVNRHLAGDNELLSALLPQGPSEKDYASFSSQYRPAIDAVYAPPTRPVDKAAEFVSTAIAGGAMPGPQAFQQAPSNMGSMSPQQIQEAFASQGAPQGFVRAVPTPKQVTLEGSQQAGYVVPPSTTNPTVTNRVLESIAGKDATAIDASLKNQDVTNALARKAVGLAEDTPISKEALAAVRNAAGSAYDTLRKVGKVELDDVATKGLDAIATKYSGSNLSKAISGANDIPKIVDAVKSESLDGPTAVDAIGLLREKASAAYASGDSGLGKAYRSISEQLENLMERNLDGKALQAFRDARQLMAKTYSVESALNPGTGNVVGSKLASQLAKGKPLSGDLLTAAKFASTFPKAAKEVVDSGAVRNTDVILGGLGAVMKGHAWPLLYPFARLGAREGLLSPLGQRLATAGPGSLPPSLLTGAQAGTEDLLAQ